MRRGLPRSFGLGLGAALGVALGLSGARAAEAKDVALGTLDPEGRVRAVRAIDVDGDGRLDLVVLVEVASAEGPPTNDVLILRTPKDPDPRSFFRVADVTRIACDGPAAGGRATAGALAVGRFGEKGRVWLRFLGDDVFDVTPDGTPVPAAARAPRPTLLARSPGLPVVFWDATADLDRDGVDETWFPEADGHVRVRGLDLLATDEAQRTETQLFLRKVRVPTLTPADVDGDGVLELVHLDGTHLVVERPLGKEGARAPTRIDLPFLAPDPTLEPEELRSPRLTVADVDGDGKADLLVTQVRGRADKVGGLRTSLFHYPGPFIDPATGALVPPKGRIDTEIGGAPPAVRRHRRRRAPRLRRRLDPRHAPST